MIVSCLCSFGIVLPKPAVIPSDIVIYRKLGSVGDMRQGNEIRGLRPCGATMRAARSDQAVATVPLGRSCPYSRRTKRTLGQTSVLPQMRHLVLRRRFSNATTSRVAPALCGVDRSVLRLSFARIRVDTVGRAARRSIPQTLQSRGLALDQVGSERPAHVAMHFSRPSLYRLRTWGPCFAVRFGGLNHSVRS